MAAIPEEERMVVVPAFRPLQPTTSPFARSYEEAIDAGFHVHAVGPGVKKPQNWSGTHWYDAVGWQFRSDTPASDKTIRMWALAGCKYRRCDGLAGWRGILLGCVGFRRDR